jgi:hypothetical protein
MAKALGLSRTPTEISDVAQTGGFSELIDHVTVIGEASSRHDCRPSGRPALP